MSEFSPEAQAIIKAAQQLAFSKHNGIQNVIVDYNRPGIVTITIAQPGAFETRVESWIGVDLDGTAAFYDGSWRGHDHIGEPILPMIARIRGWLAEGQKVKIFTARAASPEAISHIKAYMLQHVGQELEVTNQKDYGMIELWDDRAVRVVMNEGRRCCPA